MGVRTFLNRRQITTTSFLGNQCGIAVCVCVYIYDFLLPRPSLDYIEYTLNYYYKAAGRKIHTRDFTRPSTIVFQDTRTCYTPFFLRTHMQATTKAKGVIKEGGMTLLALFSKLKCSIVVYYKVQTFTMAVVL